MHYFTLESEKFFNLRHPDEVFWSSITTMAGKDFEREVQLELITYDRVVTISISNEYMVNNALFSGIEYQTAVPFINSMAQVTKEAGALTI